MATSDNTIFTKKITKGYSITVDECYRDIAMHNWYALEAKSGNVYAARNIVTNKIRKGYYLHRVIYELIIGRPLLRSELVDHIDRNGLNCIASNLRLANNQQNTCNARMRTHNASGFKGVVTYGKRFAAYIKVGGKSIYLGMYDTAELAAIAYDNAAKEYFGEYARTNLMLNNLEAVEL